LERFIFQSTLSELAFACALATEDYAVDEITIIINKYAIAEGQGGRNF
jgi:hypothetical protein